MNRLDIQLWERTVRDPAENAIVRKTVEFRHGKAHAAYDLAAIPGGWAFKYWYTFTDGAGGFTPWRTAPTLAQAVVAALEHLHRKCRNQDRGGDDLARLIEAQIIQPSFEGLS